jgi:cytochrome c-type biogenesis protein CcmH
MNKNIPVWLLFLLLIAPYICQAMEPYEFPNEEVRKRFQQLTYEFRCPKCQNQNIADSHAPIAEDLRREVHRLLTEGRNNEEIVEFMVERYGNFVLYRPPFSKQTVALWILPGVLVVFGIAMVFWLGRRGRNVASVNGELTEDEEKRLQHLLKEASDIGERN